MKGIRIRPEKEGLRASLYDLEALIMENIWSCCGKEWHSVNCVKDGLADQRELAYTTVMTTMKRLHDKGLLERKKDGRRFLYAPSMTQAEFHAHIAREVLDSLDDLGHEAAIALLVDEVSQADSAQLDHLEALIARKREELKKA
jgi:predicted transcriptional regulator